MRGAGGGRRKGFVWLLSYDRASCLARRATDQAHSLVGMADDEEAVFINTRDATIAALKLGAGGGPWHGHLTEVEIPENPNFRSRNHSEDRENRPG